MKDLTRYLKIPYQLHGRTFQSCDCFGILRLFYQHELNIILPDFTEDYVKTWWVDRNYFLDNFERYSFERTDTFDFGNVVFFKNNGVVVGHCGIILADGMFLHMTTQGAAISSYVSGAYSRKLHSTYKYKRLTNVS